MIGGSESNSRCPHRPHSVAAPGFSHPHLRHFFVFILLAHGVVCFTVANNFFPEYKIACFYEKTN
jgi:hypothetical protein